MFSKSKRIARKTAKLEWAKLANLDERGKTGFQAKAENIVDLFFSNRGISPSKDTKRPEAYIYYECCAANLRIWLYPQKAEFYTPDRDFTAERPDFDSPKECLDAFEKSLNSVHIDA